MEKKSDTEYIFQIITAAVIGAVVGTYAWYETFGVSRMDFVREHVDKLFCDKPMAGDDPGPKCYIIREYKNPKLQEILNQLRKEREEKSIWKG